MGGGEWKGLLAQQFNYGFAESSSITSEYHDVTFFTRTDVAQVVMLAHPSPPVLGLVLEV